MAESRFGKAINNSVIGFNGLMLLGFLGIVWLMIFGNLSTNLGFASGTEGFNNTEAVIGNVSAGAATYFGFSRTLFTILAIVLLITLLLALLFLVMSISKSFSGKGGGSNFAE